MKRELDSLVAQMYAGGITYAEGVREFKKQFLLQVLSAHRGNQCKAAKDLGVHRNTLNRMLSELAIDPGEMRAGVKRPPQSVSPTFQIRRTGSGPR